jgi:putative membrane protein
MAGWWTALGQVLRLEWQLVVRHRRLLAAWVGLLFVPAAYALIYLSAVWDPASHKGELKVGLVNADAGARYRDRDLNLGAEVLAAIERDGRYGYQRFTDAAQARALVREGRLAFVLEIPADFSRLAVPGERPGAAKFGLYVSEGNSSVSAGFAQAFAPEAARQVNTRLSEARWELVLSSAAGSQRSLDSLRQALSDLNAAATELHAGARRARDGGGTLLGGAQGVADASQRTRSAASQLAGAAPQLAGRLRQVGPLLRGLNAQRGPDADLMALRVAARQLTDGQRELERGLQALASGGRGLYEGLGRFGETAADVPLFGGRLAQGLEPLEQGSLRLAEGLDGARDASARLLQGMQRLDEAVNTLADAAQRATNAMTLLALRIPDDQRLDGFVDGVRELARGNEALAASLGRLAGGQETLQGALARLADGSARLDAGIELVRRSLPAAVEVPGGSAQGLALAVEPVLEVVAPVGGYGAGLVPNFVPVALWIGAVMAALLVHWRRIAEPVAGTPASARVAAKLALPLLAVLVQAGLTLLALQAVLHVRPAHPAAFAVTLAVTSIAFALLVFALVRLLGDLGRVLAVLLLVVQVSSAGAVLPIELSDAVHQALNPYLPLTWVVKAFRASLFDAFDGQWAAPLGVVAGFGAAALLLGTAFGRWRSVPLAEWRPPLDIE